MTLHIYQPESLKRVRQKCPFHKHLCYGTAAHYYDTTLVRFDCGTLLDYGYGYYDPPKKYKKLKIFWDSEYEAWRLMNSFGEILINSPQRKVVERIARARLKVGGSIKIIGATQSVGATQ